MIKLDYKADKPLHEQISTELKDLIISGALRTDEQLPSVRELSVSLTVNPNTVQRAYRNLEAEGIIYSIRGRGSFVAKVEKVNSVRLDELYASLEITIKELCYLGEDAKNILNVVKNIYSERNSEL